MHVDVMCVTVRAALQNCKRWLRDHGVSTSMELAYYVDSIRSLFQSSSKQTYTDNLLQRTGEWSQPFSSYFVEMLHPVIDSIGAWELQAFGLDTATTNASESFNCVLKKLQVKNAVATRRIYNRSIRCLMLKRL